MLTIEKNPPRHRSGSADQFKPAEPADAKTTKVPGYDPFSDEELWRRVGEVIARTARRTPPASEP